MGFRATGCTTIRFLREKRRSLRSPQQALSWQSLRNATTMTLSNRLANGIHGRVNSNNATRWETACSLEEIAQIGHPVSAYFALRSWNFHCSKGLPTAGAYTGTRRGWAHIIFVGANSLSVNVQDYSPSALFLPFGKAHLRARTVGELGGHDDLHRRIEISAERCAERLPPDRWPHA